MKDIFRTNSSDKNISDSSSYLDLSPLYGYTDEMQRKVRDGEFKLGLLKPDTFAEDRLLRQPPGVCIMLVMYNRYHNYAARQLRRINENAQKAWERFLTDKSAISPEEAWSQYRTTMNERYSEATLQEKIDNAIKGDSAAGAKIMEFEKAYDAAWGKLDDDLFNTARL